jgi:HTH-type transcriptional regulator / antitoxin HipB
MSQIVRTTKQIGAALRRARRAENLTQLELGEKASLRQATISDLEKGTRGSRIETLIDVLAALDLELVIRRRSTSDERIEDLF